MGGISVAEQLKRSGQDPFNPRLRVKKILLKRIQKGPT